MNGTARVRGYAYAALADMTFIQVIDALLAFESSLQANN